MQTCIHLYTSTGYVTDHRLISSSLQVVTVLLCGEPQQPVCVFVSSVKELLSTSSPLTSWELLHDE